MREKIWRFVKYLVFAVISAVVILYLLYRVNEKANSGKPNTEHMKHEK